MLAYLLQNTFCKYMHIQIRPINLNAAIDTFLATSIANNKELQSDIGLTHHHITSMSMYYSIISPFS